METLKVTITCKCGYVWDAKFIEVKRYYQCPMCKAHIKSEEISLPKVAEV